MRLTYVFADNLLECMREYFPRKYLDVLLDVARLRIWEAHDDLEKLLAVRFGFGYSHGTETFKITANAILFLDREPDVHELL